MVATRLKYIFNGTGTYTIDTARDLSEYHRKLHRQKKIYTVYGGFVRNNQSCSVKFNVAPLTWQTKAAVNRGFKIWRRMVSETLKDHDGLQSGKWNDYKVFLNYQHGASGTSAVDSDGDRMSQGEWDYSTFTQPQLLETSSGSGIVGFDQNADQWEVQILGPHSGAAPNYTRVSLVKSWTESRAPIDASGTPTNVLSTADPLSNMFNVEDNNQEKIDIIQAEGDLPPYSRESPYGLEVDSLAPVSIADNGASPSITPVGNQVHGFQALCGLIQVVVSGEGDTELFLDVESQGESF